MRVAEELLDLDESNVNDNNSKKKVTNINDKKAGYSKKLILSMKDIINQNIKISKQLFKKTKKNENENERIQQMMKIIL